MPDVVSTVAIDRPVVSVFKYLCDVDRFPEWIPFVSQARLIKPP